jgi:hypothetical protein
MILETVTRVLAKAGSGTVLCINDPDYLIDLAEVVVYVGHNSGTPDANRVCALAADVLLHVANGRAEALRVEAERRCVTE